MSMFVSLVFFDSNDNYLICIEKAGSSIFQFVKTLPTILKTKFRAYL